MSAKCDISVAIPFHGEGELAGATLASVRQCIDYAIRWYPGLKIELCLGLDNASKLTVKVVESYVRQFGSSASVNVYTVSFGDPALSRNFLIDLCHGRYIQIFDGDDLYSENYLAEMYAVVVSQAKPVVVVPKYMVDFTTSGDNLDEVHEYWSSTDGRIALTNLYSVDLWQSSIFVSSEIFQNTRYQTNGSDYRYEDYHLMMEIVASSYDVLVADKACRRYRKKAEGSLLASQTSDNSRCVAPSRYFSPAIFRKLSHIQHDEFNRDKWCRRIDDAVCARIVPIANPKLRDDVYFDLCNIKGAELVTDLVIVDAVDELLLSECENVPDSRYLIIATEQSVGESILLPDNVVIMDFSKLISGGLLDTKYVYEMWLRVVQNWPNQKRLDVSGSVIGRCFVSQWKHEIAKFVSLVS